MTLETPHRLAIVSSVGFTIEWEHKLISSASLLVKQRLALKRFLAGGATAGRSGGKVVSKLEVQVAAASPRPPSWAIGHTELSTGVLGETALPGFCGLNRAITGRSSDEELIYRLELDAEWVGEE